MTMFVALISRLFERYRWPSQARRTQLTTHEALKDVAHPSQLYAVRIALLLFALTSLVHTSQPIIDTHRNALSRYTEAVEGSTARPSLLALPFFFGK